MTFGGHITAIALISLLVAMVWVIARWRHRSRQIREEQHRQWQVHERARGANGRTGVNAEVTDRSYAAETVFERARNRAATHSPAHKEWPTVPSFSTCSPTAWSGCRWLQGDPARPCGEGLPSVANLDQPNLQSARAVGSVPLRAVNEVSGASHRIGRGRISQAASLDQVTRLGHAQSLRPPSSDIRLPWCDLALGDLMAIDAAGPAPLSCALAR
jgi:hypothetical protein